MFHPSKGFGMLSFLVCTLLLLVLAAVVCNGQQSQQENASLLHHHRKLLDDSYHPEAVIQDEYIVKLNDTKFSVRTADVTATIHSLIQTLDIPTEVTYTYNHVFKGAAIAKVTRQNIIRLLASDDVEYATPNRKVTVSAAFTKQAVTQATPVWNLDRIDQQYNPLDNAYKYNYTGEGVNVFILDTGILATHAEFKGPKKSRVTCGFNAFKSEGCTDLYGHGTHVAGTVGGKTYGVAKKAQLTNVKVLNSEGSGETAGVIAGIDYVVGRKKKTPKIPMVINMSLGGPKETILNVAVNAAVDANIFVAAAAGNEAVDACLKSPASSYKVMTVGSTAQKQFNIFDDDFFNFDDDIVPDDDPDYISWFSNQGKCVDIFAPGSDIVSAGFDCDTCYTTKDGTSMATPLVAGVAALYLDRNPKMTPKQIIDIIKKEAVKGNIDPYSFWEDSPNLHLRVNIPKWG